MPKTFSPATWMKKQTTQGFHGLDTPIRSSYAVHTGPHGQSVLADRSYSASGFIHLSITFMRKNLLVPLCGRTGGGRVRACWFCMSSLLTPFRSATII